MSNEAKTGSWKDLGIHVFIRIGLISVLFYWLFRGEIDAIVKRWLSDPSWSHGLIIPLFSLYFIHQNRDRILSLRPKPFYPGVLLVAAGIFFYPFNTVHLRLGYVFPVCVIATLSERVLF